MDILITFLTVLEVLTALLLIGIILIQQSKAGGGLGAMGGGMTETVFGAGAGNFLTRGTVILASIFLGTTLIVQVLTGRFSQSGSSVKGTPASVVVEPSAAAKDAEAVVEDVKKEAETAAEDVKKEAETAAEDVKKDVETATEDLKKDAAPKTKPAE